jgi:hypothetical protein
MLGFTGKSFAKGAVYHEKINLSTYAVFGEKVKGPVFSIKSKHMLFCLTSKSS